MAVLDSPSAKSACGGEQIGYEAGKKARGRKRHLLVDTDRQLLVCMVHSASVQGLARVRLVLHSIDQQYPTIGLIWLDGGTPTASTPASSTGPTMNWGIKLEVVRRNDDNKGFQLLPRRWVVEGTFGWLTRCS